MHVQDGDILPIYAEFRETRPNPLWWYIRVAMLPRVGDTVVVAQAPQGTVHRVSSVQHDVGNGRHNITVFIDRIMEPDET